MPGVKMETDFPGLSSQDIPQKLDAGGGMRHFPVDQPSGSKTMALGHLLKGGQPGGIAGRQFPWARPKVVALGIHRDDKGWRHKLPMRAEAGFQRCRFNR